MRRRLALRSEHVGDLSTEELALVAGGVRTVPCTTGYCPSLNVPCPTDGCVEIESIHYPCHTYAG